ncbi:hypothetical protein IQ219_01450 [Synechocystis sp. LEGE 06083]|jgi:hypothetical protein|nr:hypothetical protein [Synechocystis sp. LEGE 06083]
MNTIEAPAGFTATELASHNWIASLPPSKKIKLAQLLLLGNQHEIISINPRS